MTPIVVAPAKTSRNVRRDKSPSFKEVLLLDKRDRCRFGAAASLGDDPRYYYL